MLFAFMDLSRQQIRPLCPVETWHPRVMEMGVIETPSETLDFSPSWTMENNRIELLISACKAPVIPFN